MKTRVHDPRCLDIAVAAAEGARLEGSWPLAALGRLSDGKAQIGEVVWSAHFGKRARAGADAQPRMHLEARADVARECQRCLQPVGVNLDIDREFIFVADEETAAALDADCEDDVLVLSHRFDLRSLLEDELLLALPLVPRHERCPVPLIAAGMPDADPPAQHPFAALAVLKRAPRRR
jgi:uncharacterized protein